MRLHEDRKGPYRSVKEIAANATVDSVAADTMSAFGKELGLVIEAYLLPFAPNAIFLGGSISRSADAFLPAALPVAPVLSDLLKRSSHFERAALIVNAWRLIWCVDPTTEGSEPYFSCQAVGLIADTPQLIRSVDRQRLQHHLLHEREDRRGCADAQRQC
jgi:hypothetical protein